MHLGSFVLLSFTAISASFASAQDGGQLFTLYCSACHGADGKGAANGTFPPLAGSPYACSSPELAVKIVLHGLHGPVQVLGKSYNLEMPPQGGTLVDDQVAAILTYVRSSWGNKAPAITAETVKRVRASTSSRAEHWTAPELLKLHPIEEKPPITDLLSYSYFGNWKKLPDFTQLTPSAVEEEHSGKIALPKEKKGKKKSPAPEGALAMVWEGTLPVPETATYEFSMEADDGGRILIDGNSIVEITGAGPAEGRGKQSTVNLTSGNHKLRTEYYDILGNREIHVSWRKTGQAQWNFLSDESGPPKAWSPIILAADKGRAVIYRNFIARTTPRAIGVGFPGGVNIAYSASNLAPELLWTGDFIDAGHHWTDRGVGSEPPAGKALIKVTSDRALPDEAAFRGYQLDSAGNPTFAVSLGKLNVLDAYVASGGNLVRTLRVNGQPTSSPALLTLADHQSVTPSGTDAFIVGDLLKITCPQARIDAGRLVVPLAPGTSMQIRYTWK